MPLIAALRREAPGIRVAWRTLEPPLRVQLERGEVDLALLMPKSAPESSTRMINLYRERYVLIARKDHPLVRGHVDLDLFCELEHIVVSPRGSGFRGPTDLLLEAEKRSRRAVLSAPGFLVVPEMVATSDMVAVIPERIARHHTDRLQVLDPPVPVPSFDIAMVWHDRTTTHPIQAWLRERVVSIARSRP